MAFDRIEKDLKLLGFVKEPRYRDFTRDKLRVNAIDLSMKLRAGYTINELIAEISNYENENRKRS